MALNPYKPEELYDWLTRRQAFLLLDVRNDVEFDRFKVEGPYPFEMMNVPYMEFIEYEDESVARVPLGPKIRIVCAKEGSAKYVGEILEKHGHEDVGYLVNGISPGATSSPKKVNPENGYDLYQFIRPGKASCSYGLVCGKEMMVFDPSKNIDQYQNFAAAHGCRIIKSFETHRQADYISGSQPLSEATGAEIMAPEPDFAEARFPYTPVTDGEVTTFSSEGPEVKTLHTPGHTPGSTCYLIDNTYLISGDTVFIHSIGRPDLGGMAEEWSQLLFNTMTNIILPMDDTIEVLPGHYMDWKEANEAYLFTAPLGDIKKANSDIYSIKEPDQFFAFVKNNMRAQPEEYKKIREINAGLTEADEEQQDTLDLGKNECAASSAGSAAA